MSLRTCNDLCFTTFELGHVIDNSGTVHFLIAYRPPPSPANGLRGSDFLREFEMLVNEASLISGHMVLLGDFNMHVDCPSKSDVAQFLSIIDSAGLVQHVMGPTHSLGHTLDLIITRNEKNTYVLSHEFVSMSSPECRIHDLTIHANLLSDHHCIRFHLDLPSSVKERVKRTIRKFKDMDTERFEKNPDESTNIAT